MEDLQKARSDLMVLEATKLRHTPDVEKLCAEHVELTKKKADLEEQKNLVRNRLNEHTKSIIKPYEERINQYLDRFNADFQIADQKHSYAGGTATSSYQLVINNTKVGLGNVNTSPDQPSFKNTLSSGDRTTLALAFFLSSLDNDSDLASKIIVFDDPFNSQDAFRRQQTIYEIGSVAQRCAQVIVLSHDALFLKQVWDKSPKNERSAFKLADHRGSGSKITRIDLEETCRGRTATDMDKLRTFLQIGTEDPSDIILKVRRILETHCWSTYPDCFDGTSGTCWLGEIVKKIREGGEQHPATDLYDELNQINDYTGKYHHGENKGAIDYDQIDENELKGFVKRTLKLVNAIQA